MPKKTNRTETDFEKKLNTIIDNIISWFKSLFSGERSTEEVIDIFLLIIVMFLLLWVLKIPFILLSSLGKSLILFTFSPLDNILSIIWEIVMQLAFLLFAIFIVITVFKRIFSNNSRVIKNVKKETKENLKESKKQKEQLILEKVSIYEAIKVAIKILIAVFMVPFILFNVTLFIILGVLLGLWIKGTALIGAIFITIGIFLIMSSIMGVILRLLTEGEIK